MEENTNINNEQFAAVQQPAPAKKTTGRRIIMGVVFLVAIGAAFLGYNYYTTTSEALDEERAYSVLEDNETIADYEDYLARFPESEHAAEVKERLAALQQMYGLWRDLCVNGRQRDFEIFKQNHPGSTLVRQCDIKIDSLDWIDAEQEGTDASINAYLFKHPDGRYASEASILLDKLADVTVTGDERSMINMALTGFYRAFGSNDADAIFTYITPTMTKFLSKSDATKADVADIIARTYNEHIQSCQFVVNNDYVIKKEKNAEGEFDYKVSFSVDQHISRDNEGKTFGSYTAEAQLTGQFKLKSLTMKEISRR